MPPREGSLNVERLLHWPGAASLLRGAMVAIFALALGAVLIHFGQIGRQAALSSSSQPESAPMAPPAIARNLVEETLHENDTVLVQRTDLVTIQLRCPDSLSFGRLLARLR